MYELSWWRFVQFTKSIAITNKVENDGVESFYCLLYIRNFVVNLILFFSFILVYFFVVVHFICMSLRHALYGYVVSNIRHKTQIHYIYHNFTDLFRLFVYHLYRMKTIYGNQFAIYVMALKKNIIGNTLLHNIFIFPKFSPFGMRFQVQW